MAKSKHGEVATWRSRNIPIRNIPRREGVNVDEEKNRINKEIEYLNGFLASVNKKLNNERFVQNAPQAVVDAERKKAADATAKLTALHEALNAL